MYGALFKCQILIWASDVLHLILATTLLKVMLLFCSRWYCYSQVLNCSSCQELLVTTGCHLTTYASQRSSLSTFKDALLDQTTCLWPMEGKQKCLFSTSKKTAVMYFHLLSWTFSSLMRIHVPSGAASSAWILKGKRCGTAHIQHVRPVTNRPLLLQATKM